MSRLALALCALLLTLALAAGRPAAAQPSPATYAKDAEALIGDYVAADVFSGAVLVAKDGKPVLRKGFGLANREWNAPITPKTKFRLGSLTKQFTATAILQLAEQGKLSLDDPISKYYPAAPAAWAGVTLKHLLTHTSGIPSYTAIPGFIEKQGRTDLTPEELVALTRDKPLEFTPGARFAYDNSGYILLGVAIEKVSGQSYAAYVQDHILTPLGLADSGYDNADVVMANRAAGYAHQRGKVVNAPYLAMSLPYAAGSLYSTVDDLLAWDQALYAERPLKAASLKAMFTDYGNGYGYGFGIGKASGHAMLSHTGGINGFSTVIARYPDDRLTVIVLSNMQDGPTGRVAQQLANLWFAGPRKTLALKAATLERYAGAYRLGPRAVLRVRREGAGLVAQTTGQPAVTLAPDGERHFFTRINDAEVTFEAAASGPASGLVMRQGGVDRPGKRITEAEARALETAPVKTDRQEVAIDPALFDRYVGRYRIAPALTGVVTREGDKLFLQATGQPRLQLFAEGERDFFVKAVDAQVTFNLGPDGRASEAVIHQGGVDTPAKRIETP